jgi:hypothetical protein
MIKRKHLLITVGLVITMLFGTVIMSIGATDANVDARYLDRKELVSEYNSKNNPFANHFRGPAHVFEVTIKTSEPGYFNLENLRLESDRGTRQAVLKSKVWNYWYYRLSYDESPGSSKTGSRHRAYRGWTQRVVIRRIEENMLPDMQDLRANTEYSGYVMFDPIRRSKGETATLHVPVYDRQGSLINTYSFEFTL